MRASETQVGDSSPRQRKKARSLNLEVNTVSQITNWMENAYEPPLTCSLTSQDLEQFIEEPMDVPKWSSHNQGVERVVKMVTKVSIKYFSHEKRDGAIRLQQANRQAYRVESKQDLASMMELKDGVRE